MSGPVAMIGLGRMGTPMSVALRSAGYDVHAWTRKGTLPDEAARAGVIASATLGQLGTTADIVLTVLPDLPDVISVCDGPDGVLAAAAPGTLIVVMGTVSPPAVRAWATDMDRRGFAVVDAPVSGGVEGARDATLSIMVGGAEADCERIMPVLTSMGRNVRRLGPVGAGQLAKACNQSIVATTLVALAEAVSLGEAAGLDIDTLLDVLSGGLAGSRAMETKRARYVSGDFSPGGAAAFQHKDLGFVLAAARDTGVAMPVAALVDQLFGAMRWTGRGELDHSAVVEIVRLLSGSGTAR